MAERRKAKGARRSEHEWRSLLSRYQSSGQGVEAFCRGEAISKASFYRWRSIFGGGHDQEADVGKGTQSAFVESGRAEFRWTAKAAARNQA